MSDAFAGHDDADISTLFLAITDDAPAALELIERHPDLVHARHPQSDRYPLHFAIRTGQVDVVRALLTAGADPLAAVYPVREATMPRTMATDRGHDDIVRLLDDCLRERQGTTPLGERLCQAIRSGDEAATDEMLSSEADAATGVDARGNTPLHACVERGNWQLLRRLLDAGVPVDTRNRDGLRPLPCALSAHPLKDLHVAMAGLLLAHGAEHTLWTACALGDLVAVRAFVERRPECVDENESEDRDPRSIWYPLTIAARQGHAEIVDLLLDHGSHIDAAIATNDPDDHAGTPTGYVEGGMPLYYAIEQRHFDIAHSLLDRGARCDLAGPYACEGVADIAMVCGDEALKERVLLRGGRPMIYSYVRARDYTALIELLQPSAAWTPPRSLVPGSRDNLEHILGWAIYFGDLDLVRICLRFEPDPADDDWGSRLLQLTRDEAGPPGNRAAVLAALLEYGVDPDAPYRENARPLHMVHGCNDRRRNPADVQIALSGCLLDHGADIDALDDELLSTPLGWRCRYGDADVAEYLLSRGADPNAAGAPWARPLAWAERRGHAALASILAAAGARAS